jgi:hypothetical protein
MFSISSKLRFLIAAWTVISVAAIAAKPVYAAESTHVWQMFELSFQTQNNYNNHYNDAVMWLDLRNSGANRRCYGFWDGDDVFRVRIVATAPGKWTWTSGSNPPDPGLNGKTGSFTAIPWTDLEKQQNPCRRGFVRPSANKHALEHADGTPFFLVGDTWWSVPTFRYRWYEDDEPRPLGPQMGFKDAVRFRKAQGFNCIAMIAAFPHWANDGKPPQLTMPDGTFVRDAWAQAGTKSAKDMQDENGNRPFFFPGKVSGFENVVPDLDRINPAYFQNMDKKIAYLNSQGFIPFIEPARRDIGQVWKKYHQWPDSYTRYIQYVWSRYQAYNCIFSPIHFDWNARTIPPDEWNVAANKVIDDYGRPPFGTLVTLNSPGSSLRAFGHVDKARWLTMHQVGNQREHRYYSYLTEMFNATPTVPCLNGEPYYDGYQKKWAIGGTTTSALYVRSGMYGSVLSGGLAGHIHGAQGLWAGDVEDAAEHRIWDALQWPAGAQMQHLRTFVMSEGRKYQDLIPSADVISPNKTGKEDGYLGWAYCARTPDKNLFFLYFEKDCPKATISGAIPNTAYIGRWFNPRSGEWSDTGSGRLTADAEGKMSLPDFPDGSGLSKNDWGLKLLATPAPR